MQYTESIPAYELSKRLVHSPKHVPLLAYHKLTYTH